MLYKIIGDSCTDLPKNLREDEHICIVPLTIQVGEEQIVDDETFDQKSLLQKMKASDSCPKTACPSPEAYQKEYEAEGDVYVVTLSSQLSGSYNSAEVAKQMFQEEHPEKNIEVIDSKSASVGQTLIAMKIKELVEKGLSFEDVVNKVRTFRDELDTKFVLETLDTLRKNGRLSHIQAILCSALNIKPVMGSTPEGTIRKIDQARGIDKALGVMIKTIEADVTRASEKILGIAHCNHYERAVKVRDELMKRIPFRDSFIVDTAGIASTYANDGGIIVCY